MHIVLLSVGSNVYSKTNIDKAKRMLSRSFPGTVFTPSVMSEPYNELYVFPFRNILAAFETELKPDEIVEKVKMIESAIGRSSKDKYLGKVLIDIDLIKYDEEVLRPEDYERDYVQHLLGETFS